MPVEKILQMKKEGFSNKEIADKLGTEEAPLTHQAVTKIVKDNTPKQEVVKTGIQTMDAEEYGEYSIANGRTKYGGEKGVKVNATIEELRAFINSGWKPSMLMEKWQFTEKDMQQLVWQLSQAELRAKPITVNFKNDFFR